MYDDADDDVDDDIDNKITGLLGTGNEKNTSIVRSLLRFRQYKDGRGRDGRAGPFVGSVVLPLFRIPHMLASDTRRAG